LQVDRLGHDGRGIASWQGKTLFIQGALAGERVSARFVRDHTRFAEAVVDEVIFASDVRQEPPCPHYVTCGGCQLQHLQPEQQLLLKQSIVVEQMQRWGKQQVTRLLDPITSADHGYRNRARLGVWYETDGSVTLGFRQRQSNQLTDIARCLVLPDSLNALLGPVREWLTTEHTARAITHVELIAGEPQPAIILRHTKTPGERDWVGLRLLEQSAACRIWMDDGSGTLKDLFGNACDPRLFYRAGVEAPEIGWHPQDFVQVNSQVNTAMVAQAIKLLALKGRERVLDLFCGVGNFTLPLAAHCAEVVGVEAIESMVERGRENAALNGIDNARFIAADLTKLSVTQLKRHCGQIDALLLDPPRDGAKEILEHIGQLAIKRIVYVSCNPATLARDAGILAASGYQLKELGVMDMFPHTAHVESIALFVLRKK